MGFQRRLFDFKPVEKVTVLLKDLSDEGNASASSIPKNFLSIEIAPIVFAYYTYPSKDPM